MIQIFRPWIQLRILQSFYNEWKLLSGSSLITFSCGNFHSQGLPFQGSRRKFNYTITDLDIKNSQKLFQYFLYFLNPSETEVLDYEFFFVREKIFAT